MTPYLLPRQPGIAEFVERKSRFVGRCRPVSDEKEALDWIAAIRAEHRDATHNVYAYRLRQGNLCRHSDDGEPSGTAGMPLLEVFVRQEVYDFACVATRYFGGILLGAGGLVRAYARTGVAALEAAGLATMREWQRGSLTLPYARYEQTARLLEQNGAKGIQADFAEHVTLSFRVDAALWDTLCQRLTDETHGQLTPQTRGSECFPD